MGDDGHSRWRSCLVGWQILVFGLQRPQSCAVGKIFRQNAVVYVAAGKSADLIMLR